MFIEFIDQLRCTSKHEQSWLVASFTHREDRFILDATLGCHICLRQYPITNGIAYFGRDPQTYTPVTPSPANAEIAMRAAAFLNAAERSTLVLAGTWATHAHAVAELLPLRIFALDAATMIDDSEQVALVRSAEGIPLAVGTVDGVALDIETATEVNLRTAVGVLRPGGRLVAPVDVAVPNGVTILARDDVFWVAEVDKAFVPLQRA